jgi:predicted membrane-bound dolichyl-phosphate-mannose-protein mannosyltransferase
MARRMLRNPLALLAILSVASLGARLAWLGDPCTRPCTAASDHTLVFDESYYVNAARVIAGIHPPPNSDYAQAPLGVDPNSEHPQLAKLTIAGSIELFGDGPFAWRIGSIVFGSLAILGIFALVRGAGGDPRLALGAAALMALDNLLLVHGRIGTLDIYVVAAMLWAAALYVRGRPLLAGVGLGVATAFKMVAPYLLLALLAFELLRWFGSPARDRGALLRARLGALVICAAVGAAVFAGLLAVMDQIAHPYNPLTGTLVSGGVFGHISHMLSYQSAQSSPHGLSGIASYPFGWLVDYKPILYLNINPAQPTAGLYGIHPAVHFLGMINPAILLAALPALAIAAVRVRRRSASMLDCLGLAWFLGTWVPFELLSVFWSRTSYLYYMVIVMPGLYLAAVLLASRLRARQPRLVFGWAVLVLAGAVAMYPLTPLP